MIGFLWSRSAVLMAGFRTNSDVLVKHWLTPDRFRMRRESGSTGFAAAWDAALVEASRRLVDIAFDRAVNGTLQAIID
jgi:hypothetical protein